MSDSKWCEHNAIRAECFYCEFETMQARLAAERARADAAERKFNALCAALKTHSGDTENGEFGLVRVKFDQHGQVSSCLWAGQEEIDAAIDAARKENPHD